MNHDADPGIDPDRCQQDQHPQKRCVIQVGGDDTGDKADKGADRQVQVIDRHDDHLGNRRQRNRHRQIEQQVQPHIAHGARLQVKDPTQQQHQRQDRHDQPQGIGGQFHAAAPVKEAARMACSDIAAPTSSCTIAPSRKT